MIRYVGARVAPLVSPLERFERAAALRVMIKLNCGRSRKDANEDF